MLCLLRSRCSNTRGLYGEQRPSPCPLRLAAMRLNKCGALSSRRPDQAASRSLKLCRIAALVVAVTRLVVASPAWAGPICAAEADISRAAAEAQRRGVPLRTVKSVIEAQTRASEGARNYAKGSISIDYSFSTLSPDVHADIAYRSCLEYEGDDQYQNYLRTLPIIAAALRAKY